MDNFADFLFFSSTNTGKFVPPFSFFGPYALAGTFRTIMIYKFNCGHHLVAPALIGILQVFCIKLALKYIKN